MTLLLFSIWSNSFIVMEHLVNPRQPTGYEFSWVGLTAARFAPVAALCVVICLLWYRQSTLSLIRNHWRRLTLASLCNVSAYNLAMYYCLQQGLAAPISSLMTATAPLFMMVMAALFLGERLTRQRVAGFTIALVGIVVISQSKEMSGVSYPGLIALAAIPPLTWSIYSILLKPLTGKYPPLALTYTGLIFGGLPYFFILPYDGWEQMVAMDGWGWASLGYLSLLSTILAFGMWMWLLKYIPAGLVGFTVFLNPPMTTGYKALYNVLLPAYFSFTLVSGEMIGGALAMLGVLVAVWRRSTRGQLVAGPNAARVMASESARLKQVE